MSLDGFVEGAFAVSLYDFQRPAGLFVKPCFWVAQTRGELRVSLLCLREFSVLHAAVAGVAVAMCVGRTTPIFQAP